MIVFKILFSLFVLLIVGTCILYLQLYFLDEKHFKQLVRMNQKEDIFQFFFLLYILLAPFILIFSIIVELILFVVNKSCGKEYFKNTITETFYGIAKKRKIPMKKPKFKKDFDDEDVFEEYISNQDDDDDE